MIRISLNKPIYKYVRLDYLLSWLKEKKIRIDRVSSWPDPYENFFLKERFLCQGKVVCFDRIVDEIYGQSWTALLESDAMWRIYSPGVSTMQTSNGEEAGDERLLLSAIRVRSTPSKILSVVRDEIPQEQIVGRVKYMPQQKIESWLQEMSSITERDLRKIFIETAFVKRSEFRHEKEVRLIVEEPFGKAEVYGGSAYYSFDPEAFFEEFTVDPRLSYENFLRVKTKLEDVGVFSGRINQSQLYHFNEVQLEITKET